jgi:excisionase family DNA binding protein
MMFNGRRWISCREAGLYLGLSAKHVNDLCLRGVIPSVKVGGSRRIDLKKLEAGLEGQEKRGRA